MTVKLTKAQQPYLEMCPENWAAEPMWSDERPIRAMAKHGFVERRSVPIEEIFKDIWTYRADWRITPTGRAALSEIKEGGEK